jgi:cobalamin biosynthesis protein CobT
VAPQAAAKKALKSAFLWDEDADPVPDKTRKKLTAPSERFSALNYKIQDRLRKRKEYGMNDDVSDDSEDDEEEGEKKSKEEEDSDDEEDEEDGGKEAGNSDEEEEEEDEDTEDDDEDEEDEDDEDSEKEKAPKKVVKKVKKVKEAKKSQVIEAEVQKDTPSKHKTFESLGLSRPLMRAIRELDWVNPTPVQSGSIPAAMAGRDLLVNAVRLSYHVALVLFALCSL